MAGEKTSIGTLLGSGQAMREIRVFARKAAQVNVPVLILGETGTGKSLLGKIIHRESARASSPYLPINCAGIPDSLFESEFFGHQKGAFTGAGSNRRGILEQAQSGSLFMDEIGELSSQQQAKLLTALEDGEIRRLGGERAVKVDVRIMAATSRDLPGEVKEGRFRRDLFHRLAVLVCRIPPLRDRKEDIPLLARRLLRKHGEKHSRPDAILSPEVLSYLEVQAWPGNIRELSHLLEAALIMSEGDTFTVDDLRALGTLTGESVSSSQEKVGKPGTLAGRSVPKGRRYTFPGTADQEREAIQAALARSRGNKSRAARELGMARNTLRAKLRGYGLQ
jgi:DNA-binding NtrC family response regulator